MHSLLAACAISLGVALSVLCVINGLGWAFGIVFGFALAAEENTASEWKHWFVWRTVSTAALALNVGAVVGLFTLASWCGKASNGLADDVAMTGTFGIFVVFGLAFWTFCRLPLEWRDALGDFRANAFPLIDD